MDTHELRAARRPEPSLIDRLQTLQPAWSYADCQRLLAQFVALFGGGARGEGLAGSALRSLARSWPAARDLEAIPDDELLALPDVRQVLALAGTRASPSAPGDAARRRSALLDAHPDGEAYREEARRCLGQPAPSPGAVDREAFMLLRNEAGAAAQCSLCIAAPAAPGRSCCAACWSAVRHERPASRRARR